MNLKFELKIDIVIAIALKLPLNFDIEIDFCSFAIMINIENITDKVYKKLAIQVATNGLSFCCFDTLNNTVKTVKTLTFNTFDTSIKTEDLFADAFKENLELTEKYDEIIVIHNNNLSTFEPTALFDDEFLGSYLQYNTKVFETDFFAFDTIEKYEINNVFIPYININNFFIDQFGSFNYKHANSILVEKLLDFSKNKDEKKMFAHISKSHFEIIVVQNQKLLLFNTFDYKTPEDFIYYILFTAEQLNLNPENFKLELIGNIQENDEFYKIAFKYIRNVSLLDVNDLRWNNYFTEAENRQHFILFNS